MTEGEKLLIILLSLLPGNLFTDKTLMTLCILESKKTIQLIFLLDTSASGIVFIDKAIVWTICEVLEISLIKLAKPKLLKRFDN